MTRSWLLTAAACAAASLAAFGAVPPPALPSASSTVPATPTNPHATVIDGSFPVTIALEGVPTGISASAVNGRWICSARALSKPVVAAEITKMSDLAGAAARSEYTSFLEYRAHYLGQQASASFAISLGKAAGASTVQIKVLRDDLVDPLTRHVIVNPAVLVGCWLNLADSAGHEGTAVQDLQPGAVTKATRGLLQVTSSPFVLVGADVPNE
jgi:hypothetical protein